MRKAASTSPRHEFRLVPIFRAFAMLFFLGYTSSLLSQTYTFTNNGGAGDGNWGTGTNWSTGTVPPNPLTSGTIVIAANCVQNVSGRNIRTSLSVNPMVTLTLDNNLTMETASSTMTIDGAVMVGSATFNIEGDLDNNGTITITNNGTMNVEANGAFTNDGPLTNNNTFRNRGQTTNNSSIINNGNTFVNGDGAGDLMTNNGTITNNNSIDNDRSLINNGTLINSLGADFLNRDGSSVLTNAATGTLTNAGTFTNRNDVTNDGAITNTGTFNACEGQNDNFDNNATVTNSGTMTRGANDANFNNNVGGTIQGNGTISITGSSNFLNSGTLSGAFSITNGGASGGNLSNAGTIAVGGASSIGTASVAGTFTNSGTVQVEITGTSGTNDVLAVTGAATLGGTLNVTLLSGQVDNGDSYTVVTFASRTGTFTVNLPGNALDWLPSPTYNPTNLNLTYAGAPLPIDLISFSGSRTGNSIELLWKTASERNNWYMEIQRSADASRFEPIGRVEGTGTTDGPREYRLLDLHPLLGVNYYRIRQVDFDGQEKIFPVISVLFREDSPAAPMLVFPTLASEELHISLSKVAETPGALWVADFSGRVVYRQLFEQGTREYTLSVSHFPRGSYVLVVQIGKEIQTGRFMKN